MRHPARPPEAMRPHHRGATAAARGVCVQHTATQQGRHTRRAHGALGTGRNTRHDRRHKSASSAGEERVDALDALCGNSASQPGRPGHHKRHRVIDGRGLMRDQERACWEQHTLHARLWRAQAGAMQSYAGITSTLPNKQVRPTPCSSQTPRTQRPACCCSSHCACRPSSIGQETTGAAAATVLQALHRPLAAARQTAAA